MSVIQNGKVISGQQTFLPYTYNKTYPRFAVNKCSLNYLAYSNSALTLNSNNFMATNAFGTQILPTQDIILDVSSYSNGTYNVFLNADKSLSLYNNTIYNQVINPNVLSFMNVSTIGSIISSGAFTGYPASNAFDGDISVFWLAVNSPGTGNEYIGRDFGSLISVNKYYFHLMSDTARTPTSGVAVQYTTDGQIWTTLKTYSYNDIINASYAITEILTAPIKLRGIRIISLSANAQYQFGVGEFTIYKTPIMADDIWYNQSSAAGKWNNSIYDDFTGVFIGTCTVNSGVITSVTQTNVKPEICIDAIGVNLDVKNFSGNLSKNDTNVQHALETLDGAIGATSLKSFNAVGDGITDDTQALVNADTNGVFSVPEGTYYITADTTISNYFYINPKAVLKIKSGVTLTLNGGFSAGIYQIFSGDGNIVVKVGSLTAFYSEWWGAKSDGIIDCTTAINKSLQSYIYVQLLSGKYKISDSINIAQNYQVLRGLNHAKSTLLQYSSTATIINVLGTDNSHWIGRPRIECMEIWRNVAPTTPSDKSLDASTAPCGIRFQFVDRPVCRDLYNYGSTIGFYFGRVGEPVLDECYTSSHSSALTTDRFYGYYIDGNFHDLNNMSVKLKYCQASEMNGIATSYGFYIVGYNADTWLTSCETGGCETCIYIETMATAQSNLYAKNVDLHIISPILDSYRGKGIHIYSTANTNPYSLISIYGGYTAGLSSSTNSILLENVNGVSICGGFQHLNYLGSTNFAGITCNNCSNIQVDSGMFKSNQHPIAVTNSNDCSFTNSHIQNTPLTTNLGDCVTISGSSNIYLSPLVAYNTAQYTNGVNIDSNSSKITVDVSKINSNAVTKKLTYNGTQITAAGTFGTNNYATGNFN